MLVASCPRVEAALESFPDVARDPSQPWKCVQLRHAIGRLGAHDALRRHKVAICGEDEEHLAVLTEPPSSLTNTLSTSRNVDASQEPCCIPTRSWCCEITLALYLASQHQHPSTKNIVEARDDESHPRCAPSLELQNTSSSTAPDSRRAGNSVENDVASIHQAIEMPSFILC